MSLINPFFDDCVLCGARSDGFGIGNCMVGVESHLGCQFVCPTCSGVGLVNGFFCGFSILRVDYAMPEKVVMLVPVGLNERTRSLVGGILLNWSLFERVLRDVVAIHNKKIWGEQREGKRVSRVSSMLKKLRDIPFEGENIKGVANEIDALAYDLRDHRDTLVHGSLTQVLEDETSAWSKVDMDGNVWWTLSVKGDGKTRGNMLANSSISIPAQVKGERKVYLNESFLTDVYESSESLLKLVKDLYNQQADLVMSGKPGCTLEGCFCRTVVEGLRRVGSGTDVDVAERWRPLRSR